MTFNDLDLGRAKNKLISLTVTFTPPRQVKGRLVGWTADRLFLETDTIAMTPTEAPKPVADPGGRTPVLFTDIRGAAL